MELFYLCIGEQKQFQISFAKELQKSFLLVNADELKYDIGTYVDTRLARILKK